MTKLTYTFSVSFFLVKHWTINTLFNTQHTSNKDWQRYDQGAAGLRLSALMTHSPIGQLRQPSAMRQNNQQRTVTTQTPDLSSCDFYLWGNRKGKVYKNNPRSIEALQNEKQ
jgi:hypothetical protein